MELPALIAVLVDAILLKCPQYDRTSVTMALESVFAGHSTLLGGNSISMLLGQNNDYTNATITIGDVHAGNQVHVTVQLPQPIDPLPAAFAALASIPLNDVPTPRSDLPQASRLPFESSPHFVGREEELKALAQAIGTAQPAVVMPAVATGLGGIGKTSLVTEFAYRYGIYFHGGVFWLNCADPDQVASQIAACAIGLNLDTTGMAFDEQVQRVLNAWKSPMPRLLIFDNCENPAILDQWKPTVGGCRVLVTARSDQWPTVTQIRLGLLSPAESRALLQRLCARLSDAEADAIAEDLGHLPLALHLAGSYLATYPHYTVEQYRKDLTIEHRSLKGRGALPSPTRHEQDVEATFMLSFSQLDPNDGIDALALGMLDGAAWCAPGVPIPRDLVLALVPDGTDADDAVDALRRVQQLGLLDGTDAVVLHRLLAQVVQARLGSTDMLAVVEDQIADMAAQANRIGVPRAMLPIELHLRHVTMRSLKRRDALTATLATNLGLLEQTLGLYTAAQFLFENALSIQSALQGKAHPDTAQSMNNLARVLEGQGHYKEAQVLFEQALNIYEKSQNYDAVMVLIDNLAGVWESQGRYRDAQTLSEKILMIRRRELGENHPDTAQSMNNLAFVMSRQGQYREAQDLYASALVIRKRLFGDNDPSTVNSASNLASVLESQGQYEEAQVLFEQVVAFHQQTFGLYHPATATSINNLASVLESQGHYEEARVLFEQALLIRQTVLGENHPTTATSMNNLAFMMAHQGQYEDSQRLFEQGLAIKKQALGSDHPDIAKILNNFATVLLRQNQYNKAQSLMEQALIIREMKLGFNHPDTARSVSNLAFVLHKQRLYSLAEPLYERALIVQKMVLGTDHPDTQDTQRNLSILKTIMNPLETKEQKGVENLEK